MEQSREIASIANCVFCNAHFVVVLSAVSLNEAEGVNIQILQDRLEGLCKKLAQQPFELIRCPSCTELITGMPFAEWLYSDVSPVFTLCVFEHFNSPATLYVNTSSNVLNPQWQLILGNGPKELTLKDPQSGLLHPYTFSNWGVSFNPVTYNPQHRSKRDHLYIIDTVHQAVRNNANANQFVAQLHPHRPLFVNWEHVASHVEATSIDLSFMKI